jgi:hypothetical protein
MGATKAKVHWYWSTTLMSVELGQEMASNTDYWTQQHQQQPRLAEVSRVPVAFATTASIARSVD